MILNRRFLLVLFMCYPVLVFGDNATRPTTTTSTQSILKANSISDAEIALNSAVESLEKDKYYEGVKSDFKKNQRESIVDAAISDAKAGKIGAGKKKSEQYKDTRTDDEKAKDLKDKKDAYDEAKAKEQSTANKMLGGLTTAATGLGAMELMQGLSEQKADDEAAEDMAAYLATFRCTYAGGKSVKGGTEPIELPGGNDKTLMDLRNEYIQLAASLKERKESLGMKPGIESEEILDKAEMGLYDDENVGITQSAYASLYRAQTGNAEDQAKIDAAKESTNKKLKIGATVAVAGAAVTAIGNYALNHNNKNKSEELAAKRREMKDEYAKLAKELIDECNKTIQGHKDVVKSLPAKVFENPKMKQYRQDVQNAKSINSLDELKESVFCK